MRASNGTKASTWAMATATRVAGDEEGKGEGEGVKGDGNGNKGGGRQRERGQGCQGRWQRRQGWRAMKRARASRAMARATRVMRERRRLGLRAKYDGEGGKRNHDIIKDGNGVEEGEGKGNKEGNGVEEGDGKGGKSNGNGNEGGRQQRGRGRQRGIQTRLAKDWTQCRTHHGRCRCRRCRCRCCRQTPRADASALFRTSPSSTRWGGAPPVRGWGQQRVFGCNASCGEEQERPRPSSFLRCCSGGFIAAAERRSGNGDLLCSPSRISIIHNPTQYNSVFIIIN
jgi:hypothetical protein